MTHDAKIEIFLQSKCVFFEKSLFRWSFWSFFYGLAYMMALSSICKLYYHLSPQRYDEMNNDFDQMTKWPSWPPTTPRKKSKKLAQSFVDRNGHTVPLHCEKQRTALHRASHRGPKANAPRCVKKEVKVEVKKTFPWIAGSKGIVLRKALNSQTAQLS